jgi:hypothetical protein
LVKPFIKVYIYMPPKRKARKTKGQTQTQRQSVVVNIGTKRKSSGRGRLPPPSHQHNLAPTFVTNQQIDYTPLIASILHATAKIQDPVPIRNPVTPLSATTQSAQQMAGAAQPSATRRAGRSADNLQPTASASRMEEPQRVAQPVAQQVPSVPIPVVAERIPDAYYHDQMVVFKNNAPRQGPGGQGESGGGLPQEGQRVGSQRGRPVGTKDSSPRFRRSSAAISLEKIAKAAAKKAEETKRAAEID